LQSDDDAPGTSAEKMLGGKNGRVRTADFRSGRTFRVNFGEDNGSKSADAQSGSCGCGKKRLGGWERQGVISDHGKQNMQRFNPSKSWGCLQERGWFSESGGKRGRGRVETRVSSQAECREDNGGIEMQYGLRGRPVPKECIV